MKYKITEEKIEHNGIFLHRIEGQSRGKGGFVQNESNLSQEGKCWIFDSAKVYGDAIVSGNAIVGGKSEVYGNAQIRDNSSVFGRAKVFGSAFIEDHARVSGNSDVYGSAIIADHAEVYGYSEVYDSALISQKAQVYGHSIVKDNAQVYGNATLQDGKLYWRGRIKRGCLKSDMMSNMRQYIACALGVYPVNGVYYLYKKVVKIGVDLYESCFDTNFSYKDGKIAIEINPDLRKDISCGKGLHVSDPFYWSRGDTLIHVKVREEDVITCLDGKLRVRKLEVIGEV